LTSWFRTYEFLTLSLLFTLPALAGWWWRPDLRGRMRAGALLALPFALTERFFYPTYWSPRFLWDLVDRVGFGLEDLIFVAALGAFSACGPCLLTGERLEAMGPPRAPWVSAASVAGLLLLALGLRAAGWSMFFATLLSEGAFLGAIVLVRPDLGRVGLLGALWVTAVYGGLCLLYQALLPGVFARVWHTQGLFERHVGGVPVEELAYAAASGGLASVVLPWLRRERHVRPSPSA
jgi:hypothetical protein